MALSRIIDDMENCSQKNDNEGFYEAIFNFTVAGIDSIKNPFLKQIVMSIMPTSRRMQFFVTLRKSRTATADLAGFYKGIMEALETRDAEKGAKAVEEYFKVEKELNLAAMHNSEFARFFNNDVST